MFYVGVSDSARVECKNLLPGNNVKTSESLKMVHVVC